VPIYKDQQAMESYRNFFWSIISSQRKIHYRSVIASMMMLTSLTYHYTREYLLFFIYK